MTDLSQKETKFSSLALSFFSHSIYSLCFLVKHNPLSFEIAAWPLSFSQTLFLFLFDLSPISIAMNDLKQDNTEEEWLPEKKKWSKRQKNMSY